VAVSPHGDIFVGHAGTGQIRQLDRKTYAGEVLHQPADRRRFPARPRL
jgi:hypothetical protein